MKKILALSALTIALMSCTAADLAMIEQSLGQPQQLPATPGMGYGMPSGSVSQLPSHHGSRDVPKTALTHRNGLYYEVGQSVPFSGTAREYYPYGNMSKMETYSNGVLNGLTRGYYENNMLKYQIEYTNGVENGVTKTYYEDGNLKSEVHKNYGRLEGPFREYFQNGQMERETYFRNNREEGVMNEYFPNGQLRRSLEYRNGQVVRVIKQG